MGRQDKHHRQQSGEREPDSHQLSDLDSVRIIVSIGSRQRVNDRRADYHEHVGYHDHHGKDRTAGQADSLSRQGKDGTRLGHGPAPGTADPGNRQAGGKHGELMIKPQGQKGPALQQQGNHDEWLGAGPV